MRAPLAAAGVVAVALACSETVATSGSAVAASCLDATYTSPAKAPQKRVRSIRIGAAVFNSLADLTSPRGLGKPTKEWPFYTVKSPLTILARAGRGVTIRLVDGQENVALLYERSWLRRPASWRSAFARVPRNARLTLCHDTRTRQPLNTQFAGGFLLRRPGCVTIEVQAIPQSVRHRTTVRLGVPDC